MNAELLSPKLSGTIVGKCFRWPFIGIFDSEYLHSAEVTTAHGMHKISFKLTILNRNSLINVYLIPKLAMLTLSFIMNILNSN